VPPHRRGARGLSTDRVLVAALHVGDTEGLDALSMRHLAHTLNWEAMTLYRYAANRGGGQGRSETTVLIQLVLMSTRAVVSGVVCGQFGPLLSVDGRRRPRTDNNGHEHHRQRPRAPSENTNSHGRPPSRIK